MPRQDEAALQCLMAVTLHFICRQVQGRSQQLNEAIKMAKGLVLFFFGRGLCWSLALMTFFALA